MAEASNSGGAESESTGTDADDVPALVHRLISSIQRATAGVSSAKTEVILEASELLAVTALHAHTASLDAADSLQRASQSFDVDALTGLPNRLLFRDRLAQALAHGKRRNARVAVLFVDLDGFKEINDVHGHAIGDELLRHVAQCLQDAGREVDTVCRHGGDEFLILLSDATDPRAPVLYAEKALTALETPLRIGDNIVRVAASIGIAVFPEDGREAEELIRQADAAMYVAKRNRLSIAHASTGQHTTRTATPPAALSVGDPVGLLERSLQESHTTVADLKATIVRLRAELDASTHAERSADAARRHQAELLHLVAHELRNAMAPLQSASDVLSLTRHDVSLMPRLELIFRRQIAHISRLLVDILNVSRLNNGRLDVRLEQVDLSVLLSETSRSMTDTLHGRMQELHLSLETTPVVVDGDASRLRDIVGALIEYASSHLSDGSSLQIAVFRRAEQAVLSMEYDDRSEDPANTSDATAHDVDGGLIIGENEDFTFSLFVATEFVKLHNGRLTMASSRENARARIELCLPLSVIASA